MSSSIFEGMKERHVKGDERGGISIRQFALIYLCPLLVCIQHASNAHPHGECLECLPKGRRDQRDAVIQLISFSGMTAEINFWIPGS